MEFLFEIETIDQGACRVEAHITKIFETPEEAFTRIQQVREVMGLTSEKCQPLPLPTPGERWNDNELSTIQGAGTVRVAILQYRQAFPQSTRTDHAITKKYEKIRYGSQQPPLFTDQKYCVNDEDLQENIETPTYGCNKEEAEEPPLPQPKTRTVRKDAWIPEEDHIILASTTLEEAITNYEATYPGKRTRLAITSRWKKHLLDQTTKSAEKTASACTSVAVQQNSDPDPKIPERGACVRFTGSVGRAMKGMTGTVIRRDEFMGEVLVDLGVSHGSIWASPRDMEVVQA